MLGEIKTVYKIYLGNLENRLHFRHLGVDDSTILKQVLNKYDARILTAWQLN
jgi:hypothetical protein